MTPTSNQLLDKVRNGAVAVAVATLILALVKAYVWKDLPADLEGPLNTVVLTLVVSGASLVGGWLTSLKPGEVTMTDVKRISAKKGK